MSHELWLRQAYEALVARGDHTLANTCSQASVAFAELQVEVERLTLAADDAHLSRIAAEEERELLRTQLASIQSWQEGVLKEVGPEPILVYREFDWYYWASHRITNLAAKLVDAQSCEVDAKRYRWLRECSICRSDRSCHVVWNHYDNGTFVSESQPSKDVLDQLIDEAMPSAKLGDSHADV